MKCAVEICMGLKDLIVSIRDKSFAIKTQYKFLKLAKALDEELAIINEQKQKLIDQYVQIDEAGNYVTNDDGGLLIKDGLVEEFQEKIIELNNVEIELPDITFTLEELEDLKLSLQEIYYLGALIEDI